MTARLRVAVVDDEPMGRETVKRCLVGAPNVEIAGEARNGLEAIDLILSARPDLVFLDVQMPGKNGFEVLDAVATQFLPAVVFVTAYEQYALEAFERSAVDYLVKPFTAERFARALAAATSRLERDGRARVAAETEAFLRQLRQREQYVRRLPIQAGDRILVVPLEAVEMFESDGAYVKVHTKERTLSWHGTLESLEARLDPQCFLRVHRRAIVALDQVAELRRFFHHEYAIVLRSGRRVRTGRTYTARIRQALAIQTDSTIASKGTDERFRPPRPDSGRRSGCGHRPARRD